MPRATVSVSGATTTVGADGTSTTTVTVRNTGPGLTPALLTDVHLVNKSGTPVLPVRWSDNQVSLWPGESTTLTATYRTADLHGSAPMLRVSGWNTATATVPGNGEVCPRPDGRAGAFPVLLGHPCLTCSHWGANHGEVAIWLHDWG
ncbi:hypothetical protein [Streptomyces violascens]|uniref:hypothetical protein n=1 Tax=Streptomyces violascens TaxID=67381 RepID=UPI003656C6BF